ncbi:MAG: PRC-barrel domain-containing protein [Candidatus Kuenenbacteria bacterium]
MLIYNQQLKNLPVVTESGKKIGQVVDFSVQTESQSIITYTVKPVTFLKNLINGNLIINRGQVIDITAEKIIVQDNFPELASFTKLNKILDKEKLIALTKIIS